MKKSEMKPTVQLSSKKPFFYQGSKFNEYFVKFWTHNKKAMAKDISQCQGYPIKMALA
jgi:hypothetical protein